MTKDDWYLALCRDEDREADETCHDTRLMFADWLEERGEEDFARFCRWLGRKGLRAHYHDLDRLYWWSPVRVEAYPSCLPDDLLGRMCGSKKSRVVSYGSRREADEAVFAAWLGGPHDT